MRDDSIFGEIMGICQIVVYIIRRLDKGIPSNTTQHTPGSTITKWNSRSPFVSNSISIQQLRKLRSNKMVKYRNLFKYELNFNKHLYDPRCYSRYLWTKYLEQVPT